MAAFRPSGHELVGGPDRRDRESGAEPLRHHEHVGTHAVVLDGEHAPGASEPGLHLVGDEHDAVLAAEGLQAAQEGDGRRKVAALTELGLDHDRGGFAGSGLRLEEEAHLFEAPVGVPVVDREGRHEDARRQRRVAGAVARLRRRHRHRLVGAPVEAPLEHDRVRPAGRLLGELDRALGRLGARVRKEEPVDAVGRDLGELVGELLEQGMAIHVHLRVDELRRLLLDRGDDLRVAVTGARDRDARREVEVLPSIGGRHPRPPARGDLQIGHLEPDVGQVRCHGRIVRLDPG